MKRLQKLKILIPPPRWRLPVIILAGIFVGLGLYTIRISNAGSYLSDDPRACINCHVMNPQYLTWQHSSHREVAHCNDCHVPQDNAVNKYYFKAKDGLYHSSVFTMRAEPQVIQIKKAGQEVVQQNCIRCHNELLSDVDMNTINDRFSHHRTDRKCWECHRHVPHGRVTSLSATPNGQVPQHKDPVPDWLRKFLPNN
jgi:cytochrome c nitrite reductase small subunit